MVFDLINALVGLYGGRRCRSCAASIDRGDAFAMSEGVCRPCAG